MREVRYAAAAVVVGSPRRYLKTRKEVVVRTLMKHVAQGNTADVVINFSTSTPWSRRLSTGDGNTREWQQVLPTTTTVPCTNNSTDAAVLLAVLRSA